MALRARSSQSAWERPVPASSPGAGHSGEVTESGETQSLPTNTAKIELTESTIDQYFILKCDEV